MTEMWMKGKPVKAISIRQPWAQLIVEGVKDVENRSRYYKYRGPVLIHAGKKFDVEGYMRIRATIQQLPDMDMFKLGGFVGKARIVSCVEKWDSKWFSGPYGLLMREASPIPFYECPGQLGVPYNAMYPYCACMRPMLSPALGTERCGVCGKTIICMFCGDTGCEGAACEDDY